MLHAWKEDIVRLQKICQGLQFKNISESRHPSPKWCVLTSSEMRYFDSPRNHQYVFQTFVILFSEIHLFLIVSLEIVILHIISTYIVK